MATNSRNEQTPPLWHRPGTKMTEEHYHELERLSPDRKYEYIDGIAYMMSGGSVAHDRIAYNARFVLDMHFRSRPCTVFGADVQVFLALKKNGKPHFVYPDGLDPILGGTQTWKLGHGGSSKEMKREILSVYIHFQGTSLPVIEVDVDHGVELEAWHFCNTSVLGPQLLTLCKIHKIMCV